tara:strand:+ start:218 stop:724 length:507 start_codon:yes stop_codon:yes gene_type:complete
MKPPAPAKSRTNESTQPEALNVSNGLLNDSVCLAQIDAKNRQVSYEPSQDSSTTTGYDVTSCSLPHTWGLPQQFFGISFYPENQSRDPWIDIEDTTGGPIVRAVMSNATPAVWSSGFQSHGYIAASTCVYRQRMIESRADNPKKERSPHGNPFSRAAKQRARRLKRGN